MPNFEKGLFRFGSLYKCTNNKVYHKRKCKEMQFHNEIVYHTITCHKCHFYRKLYCTFWGLSASTYKKTIMYTCKVFMPSLISNFTIWTLSKQFSNVFQNFLWMLVHSIWESVPNLNSSPFQNALSFSDLLVFT